MEVAYRCRRIGFNAHRLDIRMVDWIHIILSSNSTTTTTARRTGCSGGLSRLCVLSSSSMVSSVPCPVLSGGAKTPAINSRSSFVSQPHNNVLILLIKRVVIKISLLVYLKIDCGAILG